VQGRVEQSGEDAEQGGVGVLLSGQLDLGVDGVALSPRSAQALEDRAVVVSAVGQVAVELVRGEGGGIRRGPLRGCDVLGRGTARSEASGRVPDPLAFVALLSGGAG